MTQSALKNNRQRQNKGFSDKQKEFFLNATHRWNIKTGATRSGKTYADYFMIPKRITECTGNGIIVLLGNTESTLERNILEPMRNKWGSQYVGKIRDKNKIYLFGKDCYAIGADKKNQVSKIQGSGMEYCYGDEITTWSEEVFQMLKSRLDKPNSAFDGTCNPDNPNHWFKKFLDSDADIYHQHYTIDDNPFLDPNFVEQLKKEYSGVYYQRYILGQWARAEGAIYDMFDINKHVVPDIERNYRDVGVAVDYGTMNPTVFLKIGRYQGAWYVFDEYYYDGRSMKRQKTDYEYADDFEKFTEYTDLENPTVVDPSAASFMAELHKRGEPLWKADNAVVDGIRFVQSLIKQGKLFITENCKHTIDEMQGYSWDEKKAENGIDAPLEVYDHCVDALRYFAYTIISRY